MQTNNQLDFLSTLGLATATTNSMVKKPVRKRPQRNLRLITAPDLLPVIFLELNHQKTVREYLKNFNPQQPRLLVLAGRAGTGKRTLLENLTVINPQIKTMHIEAGNFEQFHADSISHLNTVGIQFEEVGEKKSNFLNWLTPLVGQKTILITCETFNQIKSLLPHHMWSRSILLQLSQPDQQDKLQYAKAKFPEQNSELTQYIISCRSLSQIDHLFLNVNELGFDAPMLKELKLGKAHEQIEQSLEAFITTMKISKSELFTVSRKREVVAIRHQAYNYLREQDFSFSKIATYFNVDHSTVIHACNKSEDN